jgi:hypothetical protein
MAGLTLVPAPVLAAKPPTTWDGLVQVPSKLLRVVYLQPGVDFRGYTKVLLDPTEVAFKKNWRRNHNSTAVGLSGRVSESEEQEAISKGVTAANDMFAQAWTNGGYTIADAPAPDVLRVKTGILNVTVSAPDRQSAGRSYTFAREAGEATLFVELRDSTTGELLARAVDPRLAGDYTTGQRTSGSNRADFRDLVQTWAKTAVRGMTELKARSPITP